MKNVSDGMIGLLLISVPIAACIPQQIVKPQVNYTETIEQTMNEEADWDTARDLCRESHSCSMLDSMERGK